MSTRDLDVSSKEEDEAKQKVAIDREVIDESTTRVSWLHSVRVFKTTAEMTLVISQPDELPSPDLNQLCENFKKL
jgi:hypothetical protein